jgi:SagB-type dehydrogenase family enzyme
MFMKSLNSGIAVSIILAIFPFYALAADQAKVINLPQPQTSGGKPLMQALKERRSSREFSSKELPMQVLSDMLWAGFGVNRPDADKRTAPSAMNSQEIDIYLAKSDGLYLYNARNNSLELVEAKDIRFATGKQDFVRSAPVNLVYVANFSKMEKAGVQKEHYAALDTGFIAENVYLFCSSRGLATVVRGFFDQAELSLAMKLKPDQKVILTQTVGYSTEKK